jgi:hypothetical protein
MKKRGQLWAAFFFGTTGVYCHEKVKGFTTGITEIQGAQGKTGGIQGSDIF